MNKIEASSGRIPINVGIQRTDFMPRTAKAPSNLLIPSPKALEKALKDSADRAQRMADAFGLKVPGVAPKPDKARGGAAATRRAQKA
jgi:hypothetical protein